MIATVCQSWHGIKFCHHTEEQLCNEENLRAFIGYIFSGRFQL